MAGASREQALSLLAAARNHGEPAVKVSSLRQAGEILSSIDPSSAAELFPYLVDLHSSPETLVRICLAKLLGKLGPRVIQHSLVLMPALFSLLRDHAPVVVKQSIVSGTHFFCTVLEEMICQSIKVERWLEELWSWMIRFKDAVHSITLEPGSVGPKLLAVKFLETFVLLLTPEAQDHESSISERRNCNVSQLGGNHPVLDVSSLVLEANKTLGFLVELSQSDKVCASLTIVIINCLAGVARKRPFHHSLILSTLFNFDSNIEMKKGHAASIQYSLRTAFLGFLRCTHSYMREAQEKLLKVLRSMNAGVAADQVVRQVGKMLKAAECATREARISRDDFSLIEPPISGDPTRKKVMVQDYDGPTSMDETPLKRIRYNLGSSLFQSAQLAVENQDDVTLNGFSSKVSLSDRDPTPAEQMIGMIGALLAEGERGAESLEIVVSKIQPDLMADIVIANMKHLPRKKTTSAEDLPTLV
ncbi:hypothetical protein QJS10_CPB17g02431 [Acorus calamus]|uniref:Symplekin/Pta1 N-terminal domain-containing protein n=1 Tax=Acorus calamus TaxID=4465 RepID=A0AAV9CW65_ACOCL|nr:hypothetical protein QJS10_CPB17g02431 [Acorus calamus]